MMIVLSAGMVTRRDILQVDPFDGVGGSPCHLQRLGDIVRHKVTLGGFMLDIGGAGCIWAIARFNRSLAGKSFAGSHR